MTWVKAEEAAATWAGGVNVKLLYAAVRAGRLRAARIGAGRNLLFCELWIDEWLTAGADCPQPPRTPRATTTRHAASEARQDRRGAEPTPPAA